METAEHQEVAEGKENLAEVEWVSIGKVIPNPLNPRKNDAIRTEEMQDIITKRGWEEPLTVYRQGKMYVLLAGHRRLYAARKSGVKTIPVYIVTKPETEQEEIERIAGLQSGRVDWTTFEWAKFTYDRWLAWGKPSPGVFARQINLKPSAVKQYITVLDYFPRHEVESALQTKALTITALDSLVRWINILKRHKPVLVDSMGEDLIRRIMIEKLINRKVSRDELRNTDYPRLATENDIRDFLVDKEMELETQIGYLNLKKKYRNFNGHLISIGLMEKRIPEINPETEHQRLKAVESLEELQKKISLRLEALKSGQ